MRKLTILLTFLLFVAFQAAAQMQITGKVTNAETGEPIPGVSVVVKGQTTIGTTTDMDGNYSLSGVPSDATALVYSFVGMETKEVAIEGRTTINVPLAPSVQEMEEVVVTAIGIERERKALGYNVQDVSAEEITRANTDDVTKSLAAKAAGVNITSSSGSAGAATYITIRGAASLTGNNQPLYVVDGQPIASGGGGSGGAVDGVQTSSRSIDLNPEDIKSVTVLKGGAATALYGLQAANGAIVITTKKGTKKGFNVDFTSSVSFNVLSKTQDLQRNYSQGTGGQWVSGHQTSWGARMDTLAYSTDPSVWEYPQYDVFGALVSENSPLADGGPAKLYDQYEFFQTGIIYKNNLSVSAGDEKNQVYFSIGDRTEEGVVPNEEFGRTSIRVNASSDLTDKFTVGGNMNYVWSRGNFIQKGSNTSGVMLGLVRTPPSFHNDQGYKLEDGLSQRSYRHGGGYDNPYWVVNESYWDEDVNRFMGNVNLNYDIADWISVMYKAGIDWYHRQYKDVLGYNSNGASQGHVYESGNFQRIFNADLLLKINRDLTQDISMNLTLGNNMYEEHFKYLDGEVAGGLSIPTFEHVKNTSTQATYVAEYTYRTAAFFGDLSMDYMDMIYFGASGRNEWSTTMPEDNLTAFYPSANLGFIFTELPMLKGNRILSFGKLRASYAKTANIAGPENLTTPFISGSWGDGWTTGVSKSFPSFGYTGYTLGDVIGSSDLNHETMISYEAGFNLKFLNNRYGIDFTYFKNENFDLLMSVPIAKSTGFYSSYQNAGEMESEGIEISLSATPVKNNNFSWNIMGNFTKMENTVTKLAEGIPNLFLSGFVTPQIRAVAGEEYRSVYGPEYVKDGNGNLVINDNPNDGYRDGYPMPNDLQGMVSLGTVNPDWDANITNTLSYKGLSFSFLFDFRKGGMMYNGTRFALNFMGTSATTENRDVVYNADGTVNMEQTPEENLVVWDGVLGHLNADGEVVTDGIKNTNPVVLDQTWFQTYGSNFGGGPTEAALEEVDWIRLREISLSYRLPETLLNNLPINSAEVYFSGNNLWLSTTYSGIDPETSLVGAANGQGMDYFNMPGKKTYTFGLKVNF
jgi:TonB-linked SusC/RagA family outer membrane protein